MRQLIRQLLTHFPILKRSIRGPYHRLRYARAARGAAPWETAQGVRVFTPWDWAGVPPRSGDLFFGYYDKSPWSPDGSQMVLHFRAGKNADTLQLLLFDSSNHSVRDLAQTRAWSLQQGAMSTWLGGGEKRVIFNDAVGGQLIARIVDVTGRELAVVPYPVQTVHPSGLEAMSLNFRRLFALRQEYGYGNEVSNFQPDQPLDRDGIWRVNLQSGKGELIVRLAQLLEFRQRPDMNPAATKVNHVIASPTGSRCVFMHRWFDGDAKHSRLYGMNWDGSDLSLLLDHRLVSHYHWLSNEEIVVFGTTAEGHERYFCVNVLSGKEVVIGADVLDSWGDGHPTSSPDRNWILTDSYSDRRYRQHLLLFHRPTQAVHKVARFLHPPVYAGPTRCDLHPRWSRDGQMISVDSVCRGTRGSYVVDITSIVQQRT